MKRRLWLCWPAMLFCALDAAVTLLGQDDLYWQGFWADVNEANPAGYFLLSQHPLAFVAGILVWIALFTTATLCLPERLAVIIALSVAVGHAVGAATWLLIWDVVYPIGLTSAVGLLLAADSFIWLGWKRFRGPRADSWRAIPVKDELRRQFVYDAWANREIVASLRQAPAPPPRALQLLAHIVGAQQTWWGRIKDDPTKFVVWPEWTLLQCEGGLAHTHTRLMALVDDLTPTELARVVSYKNAAGDSFSNTVEDILRHVLLHGSYHRGQIATHLRLSGQNVAATDFIFAVRQGCLEEPPA